ncbi:hypothetical protein K2173_001664 [Erythroxylum novogranatense]|uniref:Glabrous enhancer-binding protein-like DBD domain-containing protein n=1 Tax=Erythroxylum novogranatense TaxID=1862640 RepID=A0AAV8T5F3_9ROSI|nr:hypothetical protein K2173_001664 [Erythroxylum novogranatense]
MTPKRPTHMEYGEDDEGKEGEEDKDEEEEEDHSFDQEDEAQGMPSNLSSPPFHTQTSKKPDSPTQQPDLDSEFETQSESESKLQVKNAITKHAASKPMEVGTPPKATKPRSKTLKPAIGEKRFSEVDRTPTKDLEKATVKDSEAGGKKSEDAKKQLFQRLWSEDDEILCVKRIIEFNETKGIDPAKDMNLFYDFIKKSLHFDVTLTHLKDKVWRLKKKFGNHVVKGKKGEDKIFAKPHDHKAFELWKKNWGSEKSGGVGVESSAANPNGKAKKGGKSLAELKAELGLSSGKEGDKAEKAEVDVGRSASESKSSGMFDKIIDFAGMVDYVTKKRLDLIDEPRRRDGREVEKLHVEEVELFLKRIELMREKTKLMLEAYKAQED